MVVEEERSRVARDMPSEVAVKRKSVKEAEKKEKAAARKMKTTEQIVGKLEQAQGKKGESVSRLDRSGWAKNPCPYYGGSPEGAEDQPARQPGAEIFEYEHPNTSYTVDLVVTSTGAVQCPGCGE